LDSACTALAESGLALKYWAEAVLTVVYVWNFIPSSRNPGNIPGEIWTGRRQDVVHLRPFGATVYAHIPSDLNLSKLFPRSVKVSLLEYYGHNGYKLLERSTGTIFKSRDIIFEEGETHYAKQPTSVIFTDNTDPFPYQRHNSNSVPDNVDIPSTSTIPKETLMKTIPQEIAPQPLPITELHENREHINSSISEHEDMNSENGNQVENEN